MALTTPQTSPQTTPELVDPDLLEVGDVIEVDDLTGGFCGPIVWLARHGDWVSVDVAGTAHRTFNVHSHKALRWSAVSA